METRDFKLGQVMTLAGEVRTISMLDMDDNLLPEGVVEVTMRCVLADQPPAVPFTEGDTNG